MKASALKAGDLYAVVIGYSTFHRAICLDPAKQYGNRPMARYPNGAVGSLQRLGDNWDDGLLAELFVVEPFDKRRHTHKNGWSLFAVEYDRGKGQPPIWLPRALYIQMVKDTWADHLAGVEKRAREAADAEAEWERTKPEREAAEQNRAAERQRFADARKREDAERDHQVRVIAEALSRLGIDCGFDYRRTRVEVSIEDIRKLIAMVNEDELAMAVLAVR